MKLGEEYDLICVGAGIMSATLALLVKQLKPDLKVLIIERLDKVAQESSAAWNNAGTGHSALCELNYTPEDNRGMVHIEKAVNICTQFEISKQFWSFLVLQGYIKDPKSFITPVPHHSWVKGEENVEYLEKRFKVFKEHFMFNTIEFSREVEQMKEWFPLMMHGRSEDEVMAASRIDRGTEMNYGSLTEQLFDILEKEYDTKVLFNTEVVDIDPDKNEDWFLKMENLETSRKQTLDAEHIFIGAGGGSLLLLQKVEIDEKDGYGGFSVSGEWLVCKNRDLINQHNAKVYSKAGLGDSPMSVPHLDTRFINGKKELLSYTPSIRFMFL